MNALGTQLLVELKRCNPEILDNLDYIQQGLIDSAKAIGATVIGQTFHHFSPHGVTGVVAIAESHLSIHTWPEYGYAAVDIFTCGENCDPHLAVGLLAQLLESQEPSVIEIKRGILSPSLKPAHT